RARGGRPRPAFPPPPRERPPAARPPPARAAWKAYRRALFAPEGMIGALGARRKQGGRFKIHTSACSGDSGGPLVANTAAGPVEGGTVSYGGAPCGLPRAPRVYSRGSSPPPFINRPPPPPAPSTPPDPIRPPRLG